MHYSTILREIDAELNKLLQVRDLLAGTAETAPLIPRKGSKKRLAKRIVSVRRKAVNPVESVALRLSLLTAPTTSDGTASILTPTVTVLPPQQKREYRRAIKAFVPEPRALAAPRSSEVVVYMAPSTSTKAVAIVPASQLAVSENLEAVMRQKLFGVTNR